MEQRPNNAAADACLERVLAWLRQDLEQEGAHIELNADTPLMEQRVLDSMKVLTFVETNAMRSLV